MYKPCGRLMWRSLLAAAQANKPTNQPAAAEQAELDAQQQQKERERMIETRMTDTRILRLETFDQSSTEKAFSDVQDRLKESSTHCSGAVVLVVVRAGGVVGVGC